MGFKDKKKPPATEPEAPQDIKERLKSPDLDAAGDALSGAASSPQVRGAIEHAIKSDGYKSRKFWIAVASVAIVVLMVVYFGADPDKAIQYITAIAGLYTGGNAAERYTNKSN